jgi:glycoprotein endo-alpha-1,2-mannosidase
MRLTIRSFAAALVALSALCLPALARAGSAAVAAFYYPWFGSPQDGGYEHWAQNGHAPPADIASNYYPAVGPYSSSNAAVIATQLNEVESAGIDELVVSWWGRGSNEDKVLPDVIAGAAATGTLIAVHVEPYPGRSVASVLADAAYLRGLGIRTLYVYEPFAGIAPGDWAVANDSLRADGITIFAQTALPGQAAAGHFNGLYTYDIVTYTARMFGRLCKEAHALGLLCAPSVGPGYDARRDRGDPRVKPRRRGLTYDAMWHAAVAAGADDVTITSFNEWQEGTQVEPAIPLRLGEYRYISYDGAWGLHGASAETSYLERTAYWAARFRSAAAKSRP